jgi:hypothetical protein
MRLSLAQSRREEVMRGKFLVILMGLMLVSACGPAGESPADSYTPTPGTYPSGSSDQNEPARPKTPTPGISDTSGDQIEPAPTETPTATEEPTQRTAFDGEAMLQDRCTQCHRLSRVTEASMGEEAWRSTVERMVDYGAVLNAEELEALVQYMAETYP